jgi:hypothetical protein
MQPDWQTDLAFLKGALEIFAHVNEKQGFGFHFSVDDVEGNDLAALLGHLYGDQVEAKRLRSPEGQVAKAFETWLFRYLLGPGPQLDDRGNAFHFSDPIARRESSRGFAHLLMESLRPDSVFEVIATSEGEDEDESERLEFAFVTETHVVLVHLGVCEA